ncbi:MAG: hypothetical protein HYZ18_05675 [Pseudogulbenkiania sp.]|nr:hypothetical protein [Pseudogulbenkiania sp.]
MRILFDDALDLVRFRVRPLQYYQYSFWQPALLLTALGIIASAGAEGLGDNVQGRVAFFLLFTWLETLLFTQFMGLWLRLGKWKPSGSLFGLVVAANGLQIIEPLTSWLPDDAALAGAFALSLLTIMVLVHALATVSGVSRKRILLGVLLFSPLAMLLMGSTLSLAASLDWVKVPEELGIELQQPAQGASDGGDASAV